MADGQGARHPGRLDPWRLIGWLVLAFSLLMLAGCAAVFFTRTSASYSG